MHPLFILLVAIATVFLLIVRLKVNAFLALVAAAALIGVLSPKIPLADVMRETAQRFGSVVGSIGIAIAMAAIIGQCLMESGAADKIIRRFVAALGEKYSSLALVGSGYVLSVPVFFDTVFYLLLPLARAMTVRMGGKNFVLYALAISAGGSVTHVLVPPTPGPLAMAATFQIDLGIVILIGLAVAIPTSLCGWLFSIWIDRRMNLPMREAAGVSLEELQKVAARKESELPGFWASMLPILLPVGLIACNTVVHAVNRSSPIAAYTAFLGDPNLALMAAAVAALVVLARHNRYSFRELSKPVEKAIASAGVIILITAGGGAFGGMLVRAGVGEFLGDVARHAGLSHLLLGFLLAVLFKIAQGSGTVTMITTASIVHPVLQASPPSYHPVYVLLAIGAGSMVGVWMNDSGFWIYRTMAGFTEVEVLKTKSALMAVLGFSALAAVFLMSTVMPLR